MKPAHFKEKFYGYDSSKIVFIGLGNELRGDDGAGIYFLRRLKTSGIFRQSLFIEAGISPENHITPVLKFNPDLIVFIDAVKGNTPGEMRFIDSADIEDAGFSTHSYSIKLLEDFFSYKRKINFCYIGIVPARTDHPFIMSEPVLESIHSFFETQV
jgi:hydrogenase 3 maturation protease